MDVLSWIIFGFISGVVTNIVNPNKSSVLGTILLGILGALLGGFLANMFLFNSLGSKIVSFVGVITGVIVILSLQRAILNK